MLKRCFFKNNLCFVSSSNLFLFYFTGPMHTVFETDDVYCVLCIHLFYLHILADFIFIIDFTSQQCFQLDSRQRKYTPNAVMIFVNSLELYQISANVYKHMHSDAYIFMAVHHTCNVEMCEWDISITRPADLRLTELLVTLGRSIIEFLHPPSC